MLGISALSSGSKSNSYYIQGDSGAILVDCGLSLRQLELRMAQIGVAASNLKAVFITHEHIDHVMGIKTLTRKYPVDVYVSRAAWQANERLSGIAIDRLCFIESGDTVVIEDLEIQSFSVHHDASDPLCYRITQRITADNLADSLGENISNNTIANLTDSSVANSYDTRFTPSLAVLTDLGHVTQLIRAQIAGVHGLILECNHDPDMLWDSQYPWETKQRIKSNSGHLSNQQAAELLGDLLEDEPSPLQFVIAAHLSENTNTADLAISALRGKVAKHPWLQLIAANQHAPTPLIMVSDNCRQTQFAEAI